MVVRALEQAMMVETLYFLLPTPKSVKSAKSVVSNPAIPPTGLPPQTSCKSGFQH
jgi:hypothetical protein